MSKLLLLLCCATVLVSGNPQKAVGDVSPAPIAHEAVKQKLHMENDTQISLAGKSASVDMPVKDGAKQAMVNTTQTKPENLPSKDAVVSFTTVATSKPATSTTASSPTSPASVTTTPVAPTTTSTTPSTPAPTTTVAPPSTTVTPVPAPVAGKWMVNGTDKVCMIVQMAVQFNVSYVNANKEKVFKVFDMPADNKTTLATGICGETEQILNLTWPSNNKTWDKLSLHFMKNETENHYYLHHLEVILPATDFPNLNSTGNIIFVDESAKFTTGLSNSYRCLKQQKLNLKNNTNLNETLGYLTVSDLQFQAFRTDNSIVFGLAKDCAFDTPDVVPIAVGCALAGLVVIVLVAYLVGRRRSQPRGYVSM